MLIALSPSASAGVTITGTRVVFPASESEVTVRTNNRGQSPVLVQVWVDDGSKTDDLNKMTVPFTLTPPVYRINPGKGQSVRLIYNGMPLPTDRESVYWFNLLEIPALSEQLQDKDRLELAFRTRIKIFYRPTGLTANSVANLSKLRWARKGTGRSAGMTITNPTPYYFSFGSVKVNAGNSVYPLTTGMIAPFSEASFLAEGNKPLPANLTSVDFEVLNDYGSAIAGQMIYQPGQGFIQKTPVYGD